MNLINNIKTGVKLTVGFLIVIILMGVIFYTGLNSGSRLNAEINNMYSKRLLPVSYIGNINSAFAMARGDTYRYLTVESERAKTMETFNGRIDNIKSLLDQYNQLDDLSAEEQAQLEKFTPAMNTYLAAWDEYVGMVDGGDTTGALSSLGTGGNLLTSREAVTTILSELNNINFTKAEETKTGAQTLYNNSTTTMVTIGVIAVILAIIIALLITNSINTPLQYMTRTLNNLKDGIISRDVDQSLKKKLLSRKDELGIAFNAVAQTEDYMSEMAAVAERIGNNDLTVEFKPKTAQDVLGNAFLKMATGLKQAIGQVAMSANRLTHASSQLATAANQAGQATSQIATTIQQVARGTTQQTEAVTKTASSVEEMTNAINGVAKGAQEQAAATSKASVITGQISQAITQVAGNAEAVVRESDNAASAAKEGSTTVRDTLNGMERIKQKVDISAQKVQEMGARSDHIGDIVTIIEDIASQTNLLALNAAIEAARAGEAGKGFAVVADEVRKLAERSSSSTKEISDLIKAIQKTVSEAVSAMADGAKEVEAGVTMAQKAGEALAAIQQASQAVNEQAEQAAAAAEVMSASANELVAAVDSVSAVVEENTAATEEMAASSSEVSVAVESIASVSEENSAAVEEVSASAEEMTAQVEEVSASANELATLASELQDVVNKFKLK